MEARLLRRTTASHKAFIVGGAVALHRHSQTVVQIGKPQWAFSGNNKDGLYSGMTCFAAT